MLRSSRVRITFYASVLCGAITGVLLYNPVVRLLPLGLILSPFSNLWVQGVIIVLFGALLLGCSGYLSFRRYVLIVSTKKADFVSILVFFVAGMIVIYGVQFFLLGLLELILRAISSIFDIPIF